MSDAQEPQSAQEALWAGIDQKHDHAQFHFERMSRALRPPERTAFSAIMDKGMGHEWHRPFYAHLDAFLSAARSIPEIIRCCFGHDPDRRMAGWFGRLSVDERARRKKFSERFDPKLPAFRELPLSKARNASEHRKGFAPATVTTIGLLGVTYNADPVTRLPRSETRKLPEPYGWMERPTPIQPM